MRVAVLEAISGGTISNTDAADSLGISMRQVIRLKKKYSVEGAVGLIHGNRGRKPRHALPEGMAEKVVSLYKEPDNAGCNFQHFTESLEENNKIKLSAASVGRILRSAGITGKKKHRRKERAHQPRSRRAQEGELWQIDASKHAWLEDRSAPFTLHAAIDDATGIITGAVFTQNECAAGYAIAMQEGFRRYGLPQALYSDKHTIFRSPNEKLSIEQELNEEEIPLSNFGKAMCELGIIHIKANTPQAKGRVERLWETLQDRLVIELRRSRAPDIDEANALLNGLIERHNKRFAVKPSSVDSAYTEPDKSIDLDSVFSIRELRSIGTGNTVSFGGDVYTLEDPSLASFRCKTIVEIRKTHSGRMLLCHGGRTFALKKTEKAVRAAVPKKKETGQATTRKPAPNHPWRISTVTNRRKDNTKSYAVNTKQENIKVTFSQTSYSDIFSDRWHTVPSPVIRLVGI